MAKKEPVNWNNVMKLGFDIKNSWTCQKIVLDKYSGLNCEMDNLAKEFLSNLRGNSNLSFSLNFYYQYFFDKNYFSFSIC